MSHTTTGRVRTNMETHHTSTGGDTATRLTILSFAMFLCQDPIVKTAEFVTALVDLDGGNTLAAIIIYSPLVIALATQLLAGRRLHITAFLLIYAGLATAFALSYAVHPEYGDVLFDRDWTYNALDSVFSPLSAIWSVLFISALRTPRAIYLSLTLFAYLNFVYGLVRYASFLMRGYWIAYVQTGTEIESSYSLGFGYDMLFSTLIFAILAFKGVRVWTHVTLTVIGIVLVFLGGSRASLGIAIAGIVVFIAYFSRGYIKRSPVALASLTIVTLLGTLAAVQFDAVVQMLSRTLTSLGYSSRSLEALTNGEFTDDNGRDGIHQISVGLINEKPLFGHGYFGDRNAIRDAFWWGYPHSIIHEFQVTFGLLGGSILLGALAIWTIACFLQARNTEYQGLLILFGLQTMQLAVSNSYLYSVHFWATIALTVIIASDCHVGARPTRTTERLVE